MRINDNKNRFGFLAIACQYGFDLAVKHVSFFFRFLTINKEQVFFHMFCVYYMSNTKKTNQKYIINDTYVSKKNRLRV